MSYLGQTVTMEDAIVLRDTRSTANVFWYEPGLGSKQRMVVFSYAKARQEHAKLLRRIAGEMEHWWSRPTT
jgi:hypothetical protein